MSSAARRVATAWLPGFGLQVKARKHPEIRELPTVLEGPGGRVACCSRSALAQGVREGQTLARARASCPGLAIVRVEEDELSPVRAEILDALDAVAPGAEWAGGGTFHARAEGLGAVHGSERSLLVRLWEAVRERHLVARVGCAGTRLVSSLAARAVRGFTVVPAGGDVQFLAPLPVDALPLPADVFERLFLLGVRTIGDFARLPPDGLADRFGSEVARWRRVVRGEDPEPLATRTPSDVPAAVRELEEPVAGLEPVTFLLKSCAGELADELMRRGEAAATLELALRLDRPFPRPGERVRDAWERRRLEPSRALTAARPILDLCRLELEARPVRAPILDLVLAAWDRRPVRPESGELFGESRDPAALGAIVDRLRIVVGPESVVTPAPREAWRREARVGWEPFEPDLAQEATATRSADSPPSELRAERLLPRPVPAAVTLPRRSRGTGAGEEALLPGRLLLAPDRNAGLPERVEIVDAAGPVRVSGEWWDRGADVDRDEHLLLGADGGLYRACRDRRTGRWALLGVLD